MSIRVMSLVWEHFEGTQTELLLALALADFANDEGTNIFPSIGTMARKTRQSERSVQRILGRLRAKGWLQLLGDVQANRYSTREYRISPEWLRGVTVSPLKRFVRARVTRGEAVDKLRTSCAEERPGVTVEALRGDTALSPDPS